MFVVSRGTMISEILGALRSYAFFQAIGMHCMGCAMASAETVEQACYAHEVDPDEFIDGLNCFLTEQK